jgi:NTP pyrophosphatase (non-canonical NTP hydrolase)
MPSSEELQFAFAPGELEREDSEYHAKKDALSRELDKITEKVKSREMDMLASQIHVVNDDKGFWIDPVEMDKWQAKLMLVVTEVAEVTEALRKSQGPSAVTEEFADIFIRCLDIYHVLVEAGEAEPNLYQVIIDKVEKNKTRPPKHGNRWG